MRRVLTGLIRGYKLVISPFLGQNCRFHPGCANYAIEAIETHGCLLGGWYAARRILKCHPLHPGGFDPVPDPAGQGGRAVCPGTGDGAQCLRGQANSRETTIQPQQ